MEKEDFVDLYSNSKPLISVVIPVYKVERYLDRCMESIVNQTYKNLEIILVDDGSPDKCSEMCEVWACKDKRIKAVHKKNEGLSSARNYGIELATGEYLTFLDSDDWLELDAIEYLYELIVKYDADFSMGENIRTKEKCNLNTDKIIEKELSQEGFLRLFFKIKTQVNVQYAWAKLYKRELFEYVRYHIGITAEDIPTTFEIAINSNKIVYSTKVVYNYYINNNSITSSPFGKKDFDILKIWDIVCDTAEQYNCNQRIREYALINRKRANLGLLCNLAISPNYKQDKKEFSGEVRGVLENLKYSLKDLLMADIPVSRKIIAVGFCVSYSLSAKTINIWYKLKSIMKQK